MTTSTNQLVRLNKLLVSKVGGMSRREADSYISAGLVRVNGVTVEGLGTRVSETASLDLIADERTQKRCTVILHKPLGVVSCQSTPDQVPAVRLLTKSNMFGRIPKGSLKGSDFGTEPCRLNNLAVAGRLDVNSTGLLLLTQCGKTANDIIGPNSFIEKEYLVRLNPLRAQIGALTDERDSGEVQERIELLRRGIQCCGDLLEAVSVDPLNADQLRFVLRAGKKHHIRRMVESVGWSVQALKRVRIGNIALRHLPRGQWRFLKTTETVI